MGLYNEIYGTCNCPYCGTENRIFEQVKWNNVVRNLKQYQVGDELESEDGEPIDQVFNYCTAVRPDMLKECYHCAKMFMYEVYVEKSIIVKIQAISMERISEMVDLLRHKLVLMNCILTFGFCNKDMHGEEMYFDRQPVINEAFDCLGIDQNISKANLLSMIDYVGTRIATISELYYKNSSIEDA